MGKFLQGIYKPKNPQKVMGDAKNLVYRSSWELKMFFYLDNEDKVVRYSSEEVVIPYRDHKGGIHRYFVDFYVESIENDKLVKTLIEIKPYAETIPPVMTEGKATKTKIKQVMTWDKNQRKWASARKYCEMKGWNFKIMTEYDLGIKKR